MALNWEFVGAGALGPIAVYENGDYEVSGMRFDRSCSLEECSVGDSLIDAKDGKLRITAPDATHHLRYEPSRGWYYAREGSTLPADYSPASAGCVVPTSNWFSQALLLLVAFAMLAGGLVYLVSK